jgi:hypothetical protein
MEIQCIVFNNKQTMYNEIALSLKYLVCLFLFMPFSILERVHFFIFINEKDLVKKTDLSIN